MVWIDPLDGTKEFVKGNLQAVTVLIGLSINGYSRFGVVHNPFDSTDPLKGVTHFGSGEHGTFKMTYDHKTSTHSQPSYLRPFEQTALDDNHQITVAASLNHFNRTTSDVLKSIEPMKIVRLGGAGNKCANVVQGNVDSYIHASQGLKYWDMCAPESIVKGMGGFCTDFKQ